MTGAKNQQILLVRWSLVVLLAVIAVSLLVTLGLSAASAEGGSVSSGGKDDVFVVAGQISRETYGLYLVDYKNSTICIYQYLPKTRKLRLMAARTYRFDVQLDEYNADNPLPREVKKLVQQQRRLRTEKK
ncbi:MAG: hypothetical protein K8S55_02315 [Phycisphaerae bacterium]|nr:hypothetical protein [Phycisphaerae bacterium]